MASDSSDSPMLLTPESTGTPSLDSPTKSVSSSAKKSRRQTAFYPNMNSTNKPQKPFSRSAAKRESVMALGSIEHLQHYFTKTGLAARKNPLDKPHHGLVPAIGGLLHVPTHPPLDDLTEFQMPPSPEVPTISRPPYSPHVKTYEVDPESLLPGVIEDVIAVAHAWKLDSASNINPPDLEGPFDVLEVLKTTTRAVRSTRNYLLSLPDESATTIRAQFRPRSLGRERTSLSNNLSASTSSSSSPPIVDPIVLIRRSALEVLTVLRQLEENCRLPLVDDAYDAQSDGGHSRGMDTSSSPSNAALDFAIDPDIDPDASFTFSLVQVQGRYETVPVWEEEEDIFEVEEEKEKRELWDERLELGNGWLYKQDIKLSHLEKERNVVGTYLDIVDEVLFEGKRGPGAERGWNIVKRKREGKASSRAAKNRRVSTGDTERRTPGLLDPGDRGRRRVTTGVVGLMQNMSLSEEPVDMDDINEGVEDELIDDEDLPAWAKRSNFVDDKLGRVHALLSYFLPSNLQPALASPSTSSRTAFLSSLSSGQLLCFGYNACVRKSKKPWGFVSKEGIHDIIALEHAAQQEGEDDKGKKLWTFRRTDNLRLWAGALKLRYMIPIQLPSQPIQQPPTTLTPSISVVNTPLSSPGASVQRFPLGKADREPPILFDARIVAKKDDGWEDMLEALLFRWADKVVDERRVFH